MKPTKLMKHGAVFVVIVLILSLLIVATLNLSENRAIVTNYQTKAADLDTQLETTRQDLNLLQAQHASTSAALDELSSADQYLINQELSVKIQSIEDTYDLALDSYEAILDLRSSIDDKTLSKLEQSLAESLKYLSDQNYASASLTLNSLDSEIEKIRISLLPTTAPEPNYNVSNAAPGSGYSRQYVSTSTGNILVSLVAADLGSTRVIVDTASGGDCGNDCPVLSLADYVTRSGAFAGVNGTYFCPASYPSCAGKTNSFDLLVMNKDKTYFNSANNVYSTNPAVIFSGNSARYVGQALEWGRDTGVDAVISNYPLLVQNSNVVFQGDGDPKKGSRSSRGFIGTKGNTVYIGAVHSATVAQSALALQALGLENALNLDGGGSTALWNGGYKVGPGRSLPNAVLLVRK